jgi:hypothetical protein
VRHGGVFCQRESTQRLAMSGLWRVKAGWMLLDRVRLPWPDATATTGPRHPRQLPTTAYQPPILPTASAKLAIPSTQAHPSQRATQRPSGHSLPA